MTNGTEFWCVLLHTSMLDSMPVHHPCLANSDELLQVELESLASKKAALEEELPHLVDFEALD